MLELLPVSVEDVLLELELVVLEDFPLEDVPVVVLAEVDPVVLGEEAGVLEAAGFGAGGLGREEPPPLLPTDLAKRNTSSQHIVRISLQDVLPTSYYV